MTHAQFVERLKDEPGFWWVGSPYSLYPHGLDQAVDDVLRAVWWLRSQGIACYSPIPDSHRMAALHKIDPRCHATWMAANGPLMELACGLIVVQMERWAYSKGLSEEIVEFHATDRPVKYLRFPLPKGVQRANSKERP